MSYPTGSGVPDGMSAMEWHIRKVGDRAVALQMARLDDADERTAQDRKNRRPRPVSPVGSPFQRLVDAEILKRNGGAAPWWRFWG